MAFSSDNATNLNILLVGKTGNGKSSTGNSILMRDGVFKTSSSTISETKEAARDYTEFNGFNIKVVDTPGICDTGLSQEECYQMVTNAAVEAMKYSPDGYHAILIVLKYGNRYTRGEQESIEILINIFGKDFIESHGIILMTNGDGLKNDDVKFDDFLLKERQQNKVFDNLLNLCRNKITTFNNKLWPKASDNLENKNEKRKLLEDQVQLLIDVIVKNKLHVKPYTEKHFKAAQKERDKLIIDIKVPMFREEMKKHTASILRKIKLAEFDPPDERLEKLVKALKEKESLEIELKKEAKGTDALAEAEKIVADMGYFLNVEIQTIEKTKLEAALNKTKTEEKKLERAQCLKMSLHKEKRDFSNSEKNALNAENVSLLEKQGELMNTMKDQMKQFKENQEEFHRILENGIEDFEREKSDRENRMKELEANFQDLKQTDESSGFFRRLKEASVDIISGVEKLYLGVQKLVPGYI